MTIPHFIEIRTVVSEIKDAHEEAPCYYVLTLTTSFKQLQKMYLEFDGMDLCTSNFMHRILWVRHNYLNRVTSRSFI
jgi:hypothetical protein